MNYKQLFELYSFLENLLFPKSFPQEPSLEQVEMFMKQNVSFDTLKEIASILGCQIERDNDGQIIFYTGMIKSDDGHLTPLNA